ncbi:MAG: hypothetical protein PVJ42_08915 [bacterium]|jgi:hypothetical protein
MTGTRLVTRLEALFIVAVCAAAEPAVNCGCRRLCVLGAPSGLAADRSTPDNLIHSYEVAHEYRDMAMYESLLHDSFIYEYGPGYLSTMESPPERAWFGKADAIRLTAELFAEPCFEGFDLDLLPVTGWAPCENIPMRSGFSCGGTGALEITLDPVIYISLHEMCTDRRYLEVNHTWFHVTVVPDPAYPGLWVILQIIEDREAE